jgi:DNA (cytosine-5)-methyltransferase 1
MTVGSAISLFSGAGGLDLGIEAAGYSTVVAVEWDQDAADTMEKNAPTSFQGLNEVLRADLYPLAAGSDTGVTTRDILRAGAPSLRNRPDLLVGGPPCVAFSKSGFWLDWKRDGIDPAASLLQAYTRVLAEAKPRHFILENVYALTFKNKASRPAFERLLREVEAAGYRYTWQVPDQQQFEVALRGPARHRATRCRKCSTVLRWRTASGPCAARRRAHLRRNREAVRNRLPDPR